MFPSPFTRLIDVIPSPVMVRERLTTTLRELALLRSLLRLSERAAKERERERQRQQGGPGDGA